MELKSINFEQFLRDLKRSDPNTYEVSFKIFECTEGGPVKILVHPKDADGLTMDFIVLGNALLPRFDANGKEIRYEHSCGLILDEDKKDGLEPNRHAKIRAAAEKFNEKYGEAMQRLADDGD